MARSRRRPSRHGILGILLLSVSLLTLLSLPGPRWGSMTGPFGQLWVNVWARAFGIPGLCLIVGVGALWGIALLARWRRDFLWALTCLIWPLVVSWDAFLDLLCPSPARPYLHGQLAERLEGAVGVFFGQGALVQQGLALGALSLTLGILTIRWGLPPRMRQGVMRGLTAVWALMAGALRLLGKAMALLLRTCWSAARWLALRLAWPVVLRLSRWLAARLAGWQRWLVKETDREWEAASGPTPRTAKDHPRMDGKGTSPIISGPEGVQEKLELAEVSSDGRQRAGAETPGAAPEGPPLARIDLLDDTATAARPVSEDEIRGNAVLLKETLASFGISGEVSEVQPGPVITRYEFTPGSGVTISQIVSRQDDLALAMRAPRVRLLAPIPGKAAVGVEIPNRQPAVIYFREVAALRAFRDAREPLFMALGKDVAGRPFYASLDKMPHLLVAGTTGSGKSVCLNTLIVSLLMRCTPDELRLVMIDPKMLELTMFNGIPHLVRPVVTENQEAVRCLRWLTREMERRYRALAGLGVRNISAYQSRRRDSRGEARLPMMPYIVVFVDELADLMIANQSEVEVPITRLAQMARAVGIHLVLATQRPSVDIITGVIKANFPARIAFQVATKIDSRTVLDMNGAESLLGRGDMLYIPPGKAQAHRIHGAFLSDAEIERITSYLRQFPPAEPLQMPEPEGVDLKEGGPMEDPLFNEARRIVVASQQGSTSLLQRRLRIGYTRAGRLIDMLERSGIVGPPDGSRAREVLVPVQSLEEETARSERMEP